MPCKYFIRILSAGLVAIALSACVRSIPAMNLTEDSGKAALDEEALIDLIKCEIGFGASNAMYQFRNSTGRGADWIDGLEAKVSLKLTVDEKTSIGSGATYKDPRPAVTQFNYPVTESFSASLGLQASSQATAVETTGFSFAVSSLIKDYGGHKEGDCKTLADGRTVLNELRIPDFIMRKAFIADSAGLIGGDSELNPYATFNYDATFIVTYGGNINPVWTLVRITAITPGPLYSVVRTKTHNIVITFGQIGSAQAASVANANLIGQAVASALDRR